MSISLLHPAIAFVIVLMVTVGFSLLLSLFALKVRQSEGAAAPYACGEDLPTHLIQPDYTQFFPFAFFFTILHVAALMMITVPAAKQAALPGTTAATFIMAAIYVGGAFIALSILYRK